jgi:hypothetical protein
MAFTLQHGLNMLNWYWVKDLLCANESTVIFVI